MPVQYLMTYLDKPHWKEWEKLSKVKKKALKEKLQKLAYRELDKR